MSLSGVISYAVGPVTAQMFAPPGSPVTIYNSGPGTVYLSTQGSLKSPAGIPLAPTAMLAWDADNACYAATDAGTLSELLVIDNSGTINYKGPTAKETAAAVPFSDRDLWYWPCVSGENYAPSLSGASNYAPCLGRNAVRISATGTGVGSAIWTPISRTDPETRSRGGRVRLLTLTLQSSSSGPPGPVAFLPLQVPGTGASVTILLTDPTGITVAAGKRMQVKVIGASPAGTVLFDQTVTFAAESLERIDETAFGFYATWGDVAAQLGDDGSLAVTVGSSQAVTVPASVMDEAGFRTSALLPQVRNSGYGAVFVCGMQIDYPS